MICLLPAFWQTLKLFGTTFHKDLHLNYLRNRMGMQAIAIALFATLLTLSPKQRSERLCPDYYSRSNLRARLGIATN
ncbi:MAG: hypothetical protein AAF704_04870 [Cyanobacteria bacterium P01_D01_bin.123]